MIKSPNIEPLTEDQNIMLTVSDNETQNRKIIDWLVKKIVLTQTATNQRNNILQSCIEYNKSNTYSLELLK